jgi:DNA-binding SARP family transcriptional activator
MTCTVNVVYAQLLGAPRVQTGSGWAEFRPEKRYQLLAYLAYQGGWVSREKLAFLFWPDTDEQAARQSLRQLLLRIHQLDWAHDLEADRHRVRWPIETDVATFKQAFEQGKWDQVVSLYRGPLLSGLEGSEAGEFSNWLELERQELYEAWHEAVFALVDEFEDGNRYLQAAEVLERLYKTDPFDEEVLRRYTLRGHR